ncbi:MAG: RNA polymerase sigma-70 factor [Tannerellaceae bacterium]|jgi:RNA polymerase sigma-70 factor (ECF subfamily)|nr:RNA polymerase sigma-70 factor [Tannerellaceae bacterium]
MHVDLELKYVEELGNGDHKAFNALFAAYYPKVRRFLRGFIKEEAAAQDMAQDIFFRIWINRARLAGIASFNAYIFRMARNIVYDYYEHNAVRARFERHEQEDSGRLYDDIIEEEIYAHELSLLIDITVGRMPAQRKRIFTMSRSEGMSNDAIAESLKISKRTVENHITQALSDIRKHVPH